MITGLSVWSDASRNKDDPDIKCISAIEFNSVADPGFSVGGAPSRWGGGGGLYCGLFLVEMHAKTKELCPIRGGAPPGSANGTVHNKMRTLMCVKTVMPSL